MERERWAVISAAVNDVARTYASCRTSRRFTHCTALVVRVYEWASLHHRPVSWACRAEAWSDRTRPRRLPHQSTMSRRLRSRSFIQFHEALLRRLACGAPGAAAEPKVIDAKALPISNNTRDPDCPKPGRCAGGFARGYKFYCIWGGGFAPDAWELRLIHESEVTVAREALLPRLRAPKQGRCLLLGDHLYDSNACYDLSEERGHRLIAPRRFEKARPKARLGHHRHSPLRIWSLRAQRRSPRRRQRLERLRGRIERRFAMLTSLLINLPPWVRRLHRVRAWVTSKLIINAARLRCATRPLHA